MSTLPQAGTAPLALATVSVMINVPMLRLLRDIAMGTLPAWREKGDWWVSPEDLLSYFEKCIVAEDGGIGW